MVNESRWYEAGRLRARLRKTDAFSWLLAAVVWISRICCSGPAYFADGPAHIRSILDRSYLIQPPGYWLFNRCGSLFPNPEWGLLILNWSFSVLGAVVFYNTAKHLTTRDVARWAAAAYASIYFVWFSGAVHSSYASQILFPVLCLYGLLRYRESGKIAYVVGASFAFAFGAGLRPSDGAFLAPFYITAVLCFGTWKKALLAYVSALVFCLGWLVPTFVAYHNAEFFARYIPSIVSGQSILYHGVTEASQANLARFVVPFLIAFWPVLLVMPFGLRRKRTEIEWLLLLWILPGALFFLLLYISDATYLDYLAAAVLLLAVVSIQRKRILIWALAGVLFCNGAIFLFGSPIASRHLAVEMVDCYSLKYTRFGIRHQWRPNLGEVMAKGVEGTIARPAERTGPR